MPRNLKLWFNQGRRIIVLVIKINKAINIFYQIEFDPQVNFIFVFKLDASMYLYMAEVENVTGFSTSDYMVRKFHELKQLGSFICHFLALSVFTFFPHILAFNALVFVFLTFDILYRRVRLFSQICIQCHY